METWLTLHQLAEELGVHVATVRGWRRRGIGPRAHKVGGLIRYRRQDVDSWLEANSDPQPAT